MVSIAPNSDPFRGGSYSPAAPPTSGPTGSIAGPNVGGSLISGVQGGQPMLARVDRGSNVTVPYARLVMPAPGRTALPAFKKTDAQAEYTTLGKPLGDMMVETEHLYTGRVCFVLGRRGVTYDQRQIGVLIGEEVRQAAAATINARQAARMDTIAPPGAGDLHSLTRLCSFEYLERYFDHVFRSQVIDLGMDVIRQDNGQIKMFSSFRKLPDDQTVNDINGKELLENLGARGDVLDAVQQSGIKANDLGPFLRGKTLENTLVTASPPNKTGGHPKRKYSVALGDELAFQRLEATLRSAGMLDWVPDGIIMSKYSGGSPGGDVLRDDDIDAREGQLYNVAISGPAITSSWTGDRDQEVMPLDKVFICIVADVFNTPVFLPEGVEPTDLQKALTASDRTAESVEKAARAAMGNLKEEPNTAFQHMTNFSVMRMTSSQFHRFSAYKKGHEKSRLGLPLGQTGGRYIVGGWCIGQVTDSAAARATHDGVVVGTSGKAKSAHAANILVKPEWWSADLMYRKFMNRPSVSKTSGSVRSRFELSYRRPSEDAIPASKRKAFKDELARKKAEAEAEAERLAAEAAAEDERLAAEAAAEAERLAAEAAAEAERLATAPAPAATAPAPANAPAPAPAPNGP
jgi:hypothetical protein